MNTLPQIAGDDRDEQAAFWCTRLAEGELSSADQIALDQWLSKSDENARALDRSVLAWSLMDDYAAAPEMVSMRAEALEQARRRGSRRWARSLYRSPVFGGSLAAGAAALVVGALMWGEAQPDVYRTSVGERRLVVLEDGSRLSLDAASTVRVRFDGDHRNLWLDQGRAKFDVAKDHLRPFSVEANSQVVVATGTSFSVERLGGAVRVVLYEGHIDVGGRRKNSPPIRDARGRPIQIQPLEEVVLNDGASAQRAEVQPLTDPTRSLAWEAGQISLKDEPLSVAVERFNRYSDVKFVLKDATVGSVRVSGVFRAGDTQSVVEGVTSLFPVTARRVGGNIELSKK